MELVGIDKLKSSRDFCEDIRWEVTPKIFLDPQTTPGNDIDITHGYMLYVDIVLDRPAIVIMQLKKVMSKTVGYVYDIPEDLLSEAMQCSPEKCVSGMYPLTERLEAWLKKEFGIS